MIAFEYVYEIKEYQETNFVSNWGMEAMRPKTGDKLYFIVFAFDKTTPKTINYQLAMLGFMWVVVAKRLSSSMRKGCVRCCLW